MYLAPLRALCALLVVPAVLAAQTPDTLGGRPMSLRDAVAQAQDYSLLAVTAPGQVRTAESRVRSANGALLPSLSLSPGQVNQAHDRLDTHSRLLTSSTPQPT